MGANVSSTLQNIVNQSITNASSTVIENTLNTTTTTASNINTLEIENDGNGNMTFNCGAGGLNISQTIDSKLGASISLMAQNSASLANTISQSFTSMLTAALQQNNSQLNLGQANVSNAVSNMTTQTTTNITSLIQSAITNSVSTSQDNKNAIVLKNTQNGSITFSGDQCTINQSTIASIVVGNIADAVTTAVMGTAEAQTITGTASSTTSQTNAGINPTEIFIVIAIVAIVAGVAFLYLSGGGPVKQMLSNPVVMYGIIAVVIILIVVGVVYYVKSKSSSSSS
jgi:hypothetical protein